MALSDAMNGLSRQRCDLTISQTAESADEESITASGHNRACYR